MGMPVSSEDDPGKAAFCVYCFYHISVIFQKLLFLFSKRENIVLTTLGSPAMRTGPLQVLGITFGFAVLCAYSKNQELKAPV